MRSGPEREGTIGRVAETIFNVMSLLLVGVGLAVALTFFAGAPARDAEAVDRSEPRTAPEEANAGTAVVSPQVDEALNETGGKDDRERVRRGAGSRTPAVRGPEDRTLKVTVPAMSRIQEATVPYADGGNDVAFKRYAGVHLKGTGSPWEREANVYIAGHRLGYPGTDSFLAFWDLNRVGKGDKVFLKDADGKRYVYRVYKKFIVEPTEVSVTQPLEGRNIVTLQTCTLPDYSERLIVQAKKVA